MSILKIEITENHLKLLKNLQWSLKDGIISNIGNDGEEDMPPFNMDNLYEAMDLIINGRDENFNPFTTDDFKVYSDEQKAEWDKLYSELPTVIEIILQTQSFSTGVFKAKYHDRVWKQLN